MPFIAESYIFFAIFAPMIVLGYLVLFYLKDDKYKYLSYALICVMLLIGHIILPFMSVGVFPSLVYDPLFYALLFASGMIFTVIFIKNIKKKSFQEIGWDSSNILKDIGIGLVFSLILLVLAALMLLPFQGLSMEGISFSLDKVLTATFFAAGAIYEECLFRGVLQKDLEETFDYKKAIIIQGFAFLAINLFYFPFDIAGLINYTMMLILSLLTGVLAYKYSLYASATAHVVFVLLAGLLV